MRLSVLALSVIYKVLQAAFVLTLGAISVIDIKTKTIPDKAVICVLIIGFASCFVDNSVPFYDKLLGIIAAGILPFLAIVITDGGMGGGDVKLTAAAGMFVGWQRAIFSVATAFTLGAVFSIIVLLVFKKSRRTQIPFAPFISAGFIIAFCYNL